MAVVGNLRWPVRLQLLSGSDIKETIECILNHSSQTRGSIDGFHVFFYNMLSLTAMHVPSLANEIDAAVGKH